MKIVEAPPHSDLHEALHRGRITPSVLSTTLSHGAMHRGLVQAIAAALRHDDEDELRGWPWIEFAHGEKDALIKTTKLMLPPDWMPDRFVIADDYWLGCAPQGLVLDENGKISTGITVMMFRRLKTFREATYGPENRQNFNRIQMYMLVTGAPIWHVLKVWEDLDQGLREDVLIQVPRDEAAIDRIAEAAARTMSEAASLLLSGEKTHET